MYANGGIEISDYSGDSQKRESINAGIGYTSMNTSLNLTYQRGFTSAIGLSTLLQSDVATVSVGRRITRKVSARMETYYYRSSERSTHGSLRTFSGGGGFDFALLRNLIMTMSAYYQNQRTRDFSVEGLALNRLTGYLGLQYVWPSMKRAQN